MVNRRCPDGSVLCCARSSRKIQTGLVCHSQHGRRVAPIAYTFLLRISFFKTRRWQCGSSSAHWQSSVMVCRRASSLTRRRGIFWPWFLIVWFRASSSSAPTSRTSLSCEANRESVPIPLGRPSVGEAIHLAKRALTAAACATVTTTYELPLYQHGSIVF